MLIRLEFLSGYVFPQDRERTAFRALFVEGDSAVDQYRLRYGSSISVVETAAGSTRSSRAYQL